MSNKHKSDKANFFKDNIKQIRLGLLKTGVNSEFELLADNISLQSLNGKNLDSDQPSKSASFVQEDRLIDRLELLSEPPQLQNELLSLVQVSNLKPQPHFPSTWNNTFQKGIPIEIEVEELLEGGFQHKPWMSVRWKRDLENNLVESSFEDDESRYVNPADLKSDKVRNSRPARDQEDGATPLLSKIIQMEPKFQTDRDSLNPPKASDSSALDYLSAGINWSEVWSNIQDESKYFDVAPGLDYGLDKDVVALEANYNNNLENKMSVVSITKRYEEMEEKYTSRVDDIEENSDDMKKQKEDSNKDSRSGNEEYIEINEDVRLENQTVDQVIQDNQKRDFLSNKGDNKTWAIKVDPNKGTDHIDLDKEDYPISFGFDLDPFQKEAVWHLEQNESVFVAAHTSAGKTVVAEYAIALSKQHMTKTIYTSPIKALSNQKYRDFCKRFGTEEIGIITGDIQIRPEARCLVMTTEVLRSMLYRGSDVLNDVEFVVFDEVHYVSDLNRGVVWEEVLIMLPEHITLVLLSATVPNTLEFSEWVGRTRKTKIYVISTFKRPVPLEHYLYLPNKKFNDPSATQMANSGFYKIVGKDGTFNTIVYKKIMSDINDSDDDIPARGKSNEDSNANRNNKTKYNTPKNSGKKAISLSKFRDSNSGSLNSQGSSGLYIWSQLITKLRSLDLLPCVFFVFSRKKVEEYSSGLHNVDFLSAKEKSRVYLFIKSSLSRLSEQDLKLPQISAMTNLLLRGIGTHHSGLLPILKEIVELLFSNNYIKVLFATETFAMGVNMPTRSVVFTSLRKNDGVEFRDLHSGEYTQMSGRAGRRGIDNIGVVIIAVEKNRLMDSARLNNIILGSPNKLESQFKLSYSMILNLLISRQLGVEDMIRKSFSEDSNVKSQPLKLKLLKETQEKIDSLPELSCLLCKPDISELHRLCLSFTELNYTIYSLFTKEILQGQAKRDQLVTGSSKNDLFVKGRLLVVNLNGLNYYPALYVQTQHQSSILQKAGSAESISYKVSNTVINKPSSSWVSLQIVVDKNAKELITRFISELLMFEADVSFKYQVKDCVPAIPLFTDWSAFYEKRCRYLLDTPDLELLSIDVPISFIVEATNYVFRDAVNSLEKHTQNVLNLGNSTRGLSKQELTFDFKKYIKSFDAARYLLKKTQLLHEATTYQCLICPDFSSHFRETHNAVALENRMEVLKDSLSELNLDLIPEYHGRLCVLEDMGYIDSSRGVTLKGRVACQFNTCDPLVLTEMILDNSLSKYNEYEIAAILSGFVSQVKPKSNQLSFDSGFFSEEKDDGDDLDYPSAIMEAKDTIYKVASKIVDIERSYGVDNDLQEYFEENFRFTLSKLVYKWAQGTSFYLLSELAGDAQEGVVTRTILRLSENLLEVTAAAKIVGNLELSEKVKNTIMLIKRDIVFVASLYY